MGRYDHTFENLMHERGYGVRCMWQMPGPKNTMVQGMEMLCIYGEGEPRLFLVQTMRGGGWEVYSTISTKNDIDHTIGAAEALFKVAA